MTANDKTYILAQLQRAKQHSKKAADKTASAGMILSPNESQAINHECGECSDILTQVMEQLKYTLETQG